ncbi:MAG: host attachment protein [Phycisphaerales bacterium JB037]
MATRWFVTVNDKEARLYSCHPVSRGRLHVDEEGRLGNGWRDQHERGRPSALGRGPTANAAQHFASVGHGEEEERRRFARDVSSWLREASDDRSFGRVCVFASPKMLGELRHALDDASDWITLEQTELAHLSEADLAEHPAVLRHVGV